MLLGTKIRRFRKMRRMSASKLAELAGLSPSYISKLEGGNKKSPSLETLTRIAQALNIPLEFLVGDTPLPPETVFSHLPEDVLEWVAREESAPYISVAMDIHNFGIGADEASRILREVAKLLAERARGKS